MNIQPHKAINVLRSVDGQLKEKLQESGPSLKDQLSSSIDQQLRDTIDLSGPAGKGGIQSPGINGLYGELSDKLGSLFSLIGEEAGQQGKLNGIFGDPNQEDAVQKRAQELLDTYFSVESTGDRIFNFAFSFHTQGEDRETYAKEKLELIHEGFRQAEKLLGGLADISKDTRDYIDQRAEDFVNEGKEAKEQAGQEQALLGTSL